MSSRPPQADLRVRWAGAAVALGLCCILIGCGSNQSAQPAGSAPGPANNAASAAGSGEASFFHDQLITNGENLQSDFGGALLTLDMNPRDLQQDTPDHAYHTVLERVKGVADAAQRADLMRALFGTTTPR